MFAIFLLANWWSLKFHYRITENRLIRKWYIKYTYESTWNESLFIRIEWKWEQLVSMLLLFNHDGALEMRYASSIRYVYYTIMNWIAFILDFQFQCMYKSLHWTWYHLKNNSNMIDIVWQSKWWAQTDIINTVESEWIDEKARLKIIHCMKHFYTI